jgi:hypothetical protein
LQPLHQGLSDVVQFSFDFSFSHAVGGYPRLAAQQKLGLLPQWQLGFGTVDSHISDARRTHLKVPSV